MLPRLARHCCSAWARDAASVLVAGTSRTRLTPLVVSGAARRWFSSPHTSPSESAPEAGTPSLPEFLKSCGLHQYVSELKNHRLHELQHLLTSDRDTLYDLLIDAGMKTGHRKAFIKALQQEHVHEQIASASSSASSRQDGPATRSTVSYMLSPSFFQGQWSLEREIWRNAEGSGLVATCQGFASFFQEGYESEVSAGVGTKKWLKYKESGDQILSPDPPHRLQPQKVSFQMVYIYQHSFLQDRLDLFFDRQRGEGPHSKDLFCSFDISEAELGTALPSTGHYCGGDLYEGELIVSDDDSWKLRYSVTGPQKALVMETQYRRLEFSAERSHIKKSRPSWW